MVENNVIYYLDSMGLLGTKKSNEIMNQIEKYLKEFEKFKNLKFKKKIIKSPQQNNGHDCGVFLINNAKLLSQNCKLNYSQDDIKNIRKEILKEILKKKKLPVPKQENFFLNKIIEEEEKEKKEKEEEEKEEEEEKNLLNFCIFE